MSSPGDEPDDIDDPDADAPDFDDDEDMDDRQYAGKCATCAWFQPAVIQQGDGTCRHGPPRAYVERDVVHGIWPTVDLDDWCRCHTPPAGTAQANQRPEAGTGP